MTKKLEQLLDLPEAEKPELISPKKVETQTAIVNLQNQLEEFDKISSALPQVKGLGDMSDAELDGLANKAEQAFDDLMDLGMNVEAKYGSRMFEVAANMLNAAVTAKTNKIDKKLKMVELQLKKLAIDKKNIGEGDDPVEGKGYIITDRNSLLEKLKNVDK
jgi:DNA repair exonuclease SbcCD ATPase subunit